MKIENAIIHQIETDMSTGDIVIEPRNQTLPDSQELEDLMKKLSKSYNDKPDKSFAQFEADEESFPLQTWLKGYFENPTEDDFVTFTNQAMDLLKLQVNQNTISGGSFVMFVHYSVGMTHFLNIVLLTHTFGFAIDDCLNISDVQHLDISKMSLACRVNLTEWTNNTNAIKYISFIKVRGKNKVADAFKKFVGCNVMVSSAEETQAVLSTVQQFAGNFDEETATTYQDKVNDFCKERAATDTPFTLQDLSGNIFDNDPDAFLNFASEQKLPSEQIIYADKKSLTNFYKVGGKDSDVSLSFNTKALGARIQVDLENDTITIKGIPDTLKNALLKLSQ
jgi:nucleoid-associated protein